MSKTALKNIEQKLVQVKSLEQSNILPYSIFMPKNLSEIQKRLLKILIDNQDDPLTVREVQKKLDLKSPGHVAYHIGALEKRGFVRRNSDESGGYTIQDGPPKTMLWLNQYGLGQCGPRGSILGNAPIDQIPIPSRFVTFPFDEAFLVQAKGKSMLPKIADGDVVICRKASTASDGLIVVCVNDGDALIKKIHFENTGKKKKVSLVSLNKDFPPFYAEPNFRVVGTVNGIISTNLKV